jgi:HPt (histidine-containing phosphotransfer) domain-containing protein
MASPSPLPSPAIEKFTAQFREEAAERLAELEATLLELEESPADAELIGRAFRAMHTIKGSGAMFGFDDIAAFTHQLETVFDNVRNGKLAITPALIGLSLRAKDVIRAMLDGAGASVASEREALVQGLKAFSSDDPAAPAAAAPLNKGIVSHLVYSVACAADAWPEALQGFTLGGLQDNGTRLRALPALGASGGPSTFDVIRGGDGFDVAVSRNLGTGSVPVPSIVLATTYGGAPFSPIHASSDLGKTWIDLAGGLNTTALPFRMILATDDAPDSDGETFLTFSLPLGSPAHVYRLTKASAHGSWVALDGPVTYADGTVGQQFRDPPGNLITPHNLGTHQARAGVYAMTAAYGMVFTTVDAGAHWKASRPLGTCVAASCAAQQPNLIKGATQPEFDWSDATGNTLWVGSNTTALTDATGKLISGPVPDAYGHLFRTTDGGLTWLPVHGSGARQLPNTLVNTLKMDPRDPHTLYVGTVLGVYVTHDDGVTFDRMGVGLPLADVTQICVTPSTGSLKVSTYGRGFWQVDQHAAGIEAGAKGRGDLDYNQRLDAFDLLDLVAAMGATNASDTYRQEADLVGGTSAIDDADLGAFLARFGGTP